MSNEGILETEDLTNEFAGFVAVNGVSLRFERGTIHAATLAGLADSTKAIVVQMPSLTDVNWPMSGRSC
jgi:ABC-type branched-subunit amino acid transport system ATPase component